MRCNAPQATSDLTVLSDCASCEWSIFTVAEDSPLIRAVVVDQDLVDLPQALGHRRATVRDLARRALTTPDWCLDPLRVENVQLA